MDFEVSRTDLRTTRVTDTGPPRPADGEVLLRIGQCAFTANNVTYAAFGDLMGYWNFFPAEDGWGRVPVWGFAEVETSMAAGITEGERIYGYFPMSTHLLISPANLTATSFVDTAPHRVALPPVYNQYLRWAEPADESAEQLYCLLRPLFTTSFLIDDWLAEADCFGATSAVIASASSKTALALAASLQQRAGIEVVGLTSSRNAAFVQNVGYYDKVICYDDVHVLDAATPTVFVDMGGDGAVRAAVHRHFRDSLRHSCQVGATHWEQLGGGADGEPLPGPAPALFFAPDHVRRRFADWGAEAFAQRVDEAWDRFVQSASGWLNVSVHAGPDSVAQAYLSVVDGAVAPDQAVVIDLSGG